MATVDEYASILSDAIVKSRMTGFAGRSEIYSCARNTIHEHFRNIGSLSDRRSGEREIALLNTAIRVVEEGFYSRQRSVSTAAKGRQMGLNSDVSTEALLQTDSVTTVTGGEFETGNVQSRGKSKQFIANVGAGTLVNIIRVSLQLVTLPVLARLLTPSDYGIYALALPTVSLFIILADGGLGASLARESENNRILWSTAFWTLLATCCLMGVLVCCSGFILASVSGEQTLVGLMALLSASLPLLAFSIVADARLIRRGNLLFHCGADLCGLLTGAAVGLTCAFHGGGAWSLAAQYVSSLAVRALILNIAARARPHFEFDISTLSGHLSIGGWLIVMRVSDTVGKIIENSLFGRLFGADLLGSYTLAFQLVRFSCESVTNPILSAFYSHAVRHDASEIARIHLFLSRLILVILVPFAVFMSIIAPKILPSVLGGQWDHAAGFVRILLLPYAIAGASWLSGQILLRNGIVARSAFITVSVNLFRVIAIASGIWFDVVVIAWLLAISFVIQAVAVTVVVPDGAGAEKAALLRNFVSILLSASVAGGIVYAIDSFSSLGWPTYGAEFCVGGLVYFSCLFALLKKTLRGDFQALMESLLL